MLPHIIYFVTIYSCVIFLVVELFNKYKKGLKPIDIDVLNIEHGWPQRVPEAYHQDPVLRAAANSALSEPARYRYDRSDIYIILHLIGYLNNFIQRSN